MSIIVKNPVFSKGGKSSNGESKYAAWLDGQAHLLSREDMGGASLKTVNTQLRGRAKKLGKKVQLSIDAAADTVLVRAYISEPGDLAYLFYEGEKPEGEKPGGVGGTEDFVGPPMPKKGRKNRKS